MVSFPDHNILDFMTDAKQIILSFAAADKTLQAHTVSLLLRKEN